MKTLLESYATNLPLQESGLAAIESSDTGVASRPLEFEMVLPPDPDRHDDDNKEEESEERRKHGDRGEGYTNVVLGGLSLRLASSYEDGQALPETAELEVEQAAAFDKLVAEIEDAIPETLWKRFEVKGDDSDDDEEDYSTWDKSGSGWDDNGKVYSRKL
jgi:hypothetical protein